MMMDSIATWLVKDKIILTSLIGELLVDDFPYIDARMIKMIESAQSDTVHILADIQMMTTMPSVMQMAKLQYIRHPNLGYYVTQRRNALEYMIGKAVGHLIASKYHFAKSLDEGIEFLVSHDDTLPSAQAIQHDANSILANFYATHDATSS